MKKQHKIWIGIAATTSVVLLLSFTRKEVRESWSASWTRTVASSTAPQTPTSATASQAARDILAQLDATVVATDSFDPEPYVALAPLMRQMQDNPELFAEYQAMVTSELAEMVVEDKRKAFHFPLIAYVDQRAGQTVLTDAIQQRLETSDPNPELTDRLILMLGEWSINADPMDLLLSLEDRSLMAVGALAGKLDHADAGREKAVQFLEERLNLAKDEGNNQKVAMAQTALARVYH